MSKHSKVQQSNSHVIDGSASFHNESKQVIILISLVSLTIVGLPLFWKDVYHPKSKPSQNFIATMLYWTLTVHFSNFFWPSNYRHIATGSRNRQEIWKIGLTLCDSTMSSDTDRSSTSSKSLLFVVLDLYAMMPRIKSVNLGPISIFSIFRRTFNWEGVERGSFY